MQQENPGNDAAVSEVVGEMLMIGLVLILVAVFSASLANYLPSERTPSVTIQMSNDTSGNITLWHKGGDWVKASTLRVMVRVPVCGTQESVTTYTLNGDNSFTLVPYVDAFDLGSNITVNWGQPLTGNESVSLVTDRAVLFSGPIGSGAP